MESVEKRHVELEPAELAKVLTTMLDLGRHATLALDDALNVLAFNERFSRRARELFGVEVRPGLNARAIVPRALIDELLGLEQQVPVAGTFSTEWRFVDLAGVQRVVELTARRFPGGICVTSLDLDDLKKVEAALREREQQLRSAMEAGRTVAWQWNIPSDIVDSALGVEVIGPAPKDLPSFLASVHPDDRAAVESSLEATLQHGAPYVVSYRKVNGKVVRWLDARATLVRDAAGKPQKLQGVVVDVTDRKQLELQLVQAQKMEAIGRLAGGVAHDFNNLLTAITTSAHLLRRRSETPRQPLDDILEASERAAALTRQLLAFSRRQILKSTVVDLGDIVRDVLSIVKRIVGEDIELETELQTDLVPVMGDLTQLHQILLNLVVNARDAMPTGGTLVIGTENVSLDATQGAVLGLAPGVYARLRVRDTGIGMDEETRARAFEPFFTTKGAGVGTGLGLATVYGIVSQLGGAVVIESEPGRGAAFDVFLASASGRATRERMEPKAFSGQGAETILLVEDEPMVRRLTREVLELSGYRVLEAERGAEALSRAERHDGKIDLLLTDVVMPRMSGMMLARQLLGNRPAMKVLFTSGYTDDAVLRHGVVEGQVALLRKPYSPDELAQAVRSALDGGVRAHLPAL
jgi:signal transduction histidine kinase/CheY-like chemotaxis protein